MLAYSSVCVRHVYAGAHAHVCMCGGQKLMLDVFPYCSPPSFLKQGLSVNLDLTAPARLAGQQALEFRVSTPPYSPPAPALASTTVCASVPPLTWGLGIQTQALPYACTSSTLPN